MKKLAFAGIVAVASFGLMGCGASKKQAMKDSLTLVREAQKLDCDTLKLYLKQAEVLLAKEVE